VASVAIAPTIASLLLESGLPRREAEILLCGVLGCQQAYLIAHREDGVDLPRIRAAEAWFARRRAGEPVAYITGSREFYGLRLRVTPDVLVPRPETEHLVDLALGRLPVASLARVLELGTGSGAIAVALAAHRPQLRITATDVSEPALEVARQNAREHAVRIDFVRSDWFESLGGEEPFDLVVSNPPYVPDGDPHLEQGDLRFEPRVALVGHDGGFSCLRAIAAQARRRLRPGASLLLEHGHEQGERCVVLLRELDYADVADTRDLAGLPRVCSGVWRG
jgi:release factor glutamine methyltransferase